MLDEKPNVGSDLSSPKKQAAEQEEGDPEEKLKPSYTHKSAIERLDLMKFQDILDEAKVYYISVQGKPKDFPSKHKVSKYLKNISVQEMTEAVKLLDIKFAEKRLHWIAQFYYVLELPPYWDLKRVSENKFIFEYRGTIINGRQKVEMGISPAVHYLDSIIEEFRQTFFPEELSIDEVENIRKTYVYNDEAKKFPVKYTMDKCEDFYKSWQTNFDTRGKTMKFAEGGYWKKYWYERKKGKSYYMSKNEMDYPITKDKVVYATDAEKRGGWSNFIYYKPSGTLDEQKMERCFADIANKELAEKREAEEMTHFMKNWADGKGRYESEILRKMGQKYSGSQCEKRSVYYFEPKAHREKQPNSNFDNTRMNRITSAYQQGSKNTTLPTRPMTAGVNLKGNNDYDATRLPSAYSNQRPLTAFGNKSGQNWNTGGRPQSSTLGGNLNLRKATPHGLNPNRENLKSAKVNPTSSGNLGSKKDFERKVMSGYYKDLNTSTDQPDENDPYATGEEEYYNEIQEDDEDISDRDDEILNDIENNPTAHMPTFIEIDNNKRPMSVATTAHHDYTKFVPPVKPEDPKKKKKNAAKKKESGGGKGKKGKKLPKIPTVQIITVLGNNKLPVNEGLQVDQKLKDSDHLFSEGKSIVPCMVNFINKSELEVEVFYVDLKKEKIKLFDIESMSTKRHKGILGHQFIIEFDHKPFAAYKIPKDLDKTNAGAGTLETGVIIEEGMEVEAGNIENLLPLEERMAKQHIRHIDQISKIEHEPKYEELNRKTLSVWGKTGGDANTTNNGEYASNFSTALNIKQSARPFSAFITNDASNLERNEQLREIDTIKQRMNTYKMSLPVRNVERALLNPVLDPPMHREDLAQPRPGSMLVSNPKSKKKGKKKKKRGKSKK